MRYETSAVLTNRNRKRLQEAHRQRGIQRDRVLV